MKDLFVLPIGVINIPTGKTCYDWSIYDNGNPENAEIVLARGNGN